MPYEMTTLNVRSVPKNPFLRSLYGPLWEEAAREIESTLKVAVLSASGLTSHAVAKKLEVPFAEVRRAVARLQRVAVAARDSRETLKPPE